MRLSNKTHHYLGFMCLLYGLQLMKLKEEKAKRLEQIQEDIPKIKATIKISKIKTILKISKIKIKIQKRWEEIKKKIVILK